MRPGPQPAPPEDVDRDEDRFSEEEQALEAERYAERLAPLAHESGPKQSELESQHRTGHGADGEGDGHELRPALGQDQGASVVVP